MVIIMNTGFKYAVFKNKNKIYSVKYKGFVNYRFAYFVGFLVLST